MTQAGVTALDICSTDLCRRFGLDGGTLLIHGETLSIRYSGLVFVQRIDFSETDPYALGCSIDAQVTRFAQSVKRKARRTPRCYFPREEKP